VSTLVCGWREGSFAFEAAPRYLVLCLPRHSRAANIVRDDVKHAENVAHDSFLRFTHNRFPQELRTQTRSPALRNRRMRVRKVENMRTNNTIVLFLDRDGG
jgi:hypothetical protein